MKSAAGASGSTEEASGSTAGNIGELVLPIFPNDRVALGIKGHGRCVLVGELKESHTPLWMIYLDTEEDKNLNVYVMVPYETKENTLKVTQHYAAKIDHRVKTDTVAETCVYVSGNNLHFKANLEIIEKPGEMDFEKALIFVRRSDHKLMAGELNIASRDFPKWL